MILIAHRGNVKGPNRELENKPHYIETTLELGYDVEIDVHVKDGQFFLGHDVCQYKIDKNWLLQHGLWCHAKTIQTLNVLLDMNVNCFFHDKDDCVLTSKGNIWTFPGREITSKSIIVDVDNTLEHKNAYGVCSDYVHFLRC